VVAFFIFALLAATIQSRIIPMYGTYNEVIEHRVFKGAFLHNLWETVGKTAQLKVIGHQPVIVFQHVARTAGDAMRTHLFFVAQLDLSRPHLHHFTEHSFMSDKDLLCIERNSTHLVKGFFFST